MSDAPHTPLPYLHVIAKTGSPTVLSLPLKFPPHSRDQKDIQGCLKMKRPCLQNGLFIKSKPFRRNGDIHHKTSNALTNLRYDTLTSAMILADFY